ncbi:cytochrome P450 monooxygenase pc-3 [Auriculariales sp. MPI-PUGE-AT-0066]|nr:cytochrome P450 monooxygenase pc-3 [Auriculariales sp. MPI-PUGE-AT-0066]
MAFKARFLLWSLAKALVLPPLIAHHVLRTLPLYGIHLPFPRLVYALAMMFSIPLAQRIRALPEQRAKEAAMRARGAGPIPKVQGRLPGNIDVLWELVTHDGQEYVAETFRRHAERYGPTFDMGILWASQIVTVDPANVQHVLATNFIDFQKGVKFKEIFDTWLGAGIFTTDGDQWKRHRSLLKPFFSRERVADFRCFETHADKFVHVFAMFAMHGDAFDVQELFGRFTMDTGTDFLFGHCVRSLDALLCSAPGDCMDPANAGIPGNPDPFGAFTEAFTFASFVGATRVRIGSLWPVFEAFGDKTVPAVKIIRGLIDPIVAEALARNKADGNKKDMDEMTFLDWMVEQMDDVDEIRAEVLNLLLATRDTMAAVLTYTTYCLANHPHVERKLREEIERVMGDGDRVPGPEDLKKMRYLRAVINEVLRLFPPVPLNIRRSVNDSTLPSSLSGHPLYLPGNTSITYCSLLLQRREDVWGPNALMFDPERWLSPEGDDEAMRNKVHIANPFAFLPFNAGPRICLGQQFAYAETSFMLVRMMQKVASLELAPDAQPEGSLPPAEWASSKIGRERFERIRPVSTLTMSVKGGLWIRAQMKDGYSGLSSGQ